MSVGESPRVAIVFDGTSWFLRRVAWVVQRCGVRDEMVYHCDAPLGGPFQDVDDAVAAFKEMRSSE